MAEAEAGTEGPGAHPHFGAAADIEVTQPCQMCPYHRCSRIVQAQDGLGTASPVPSPNQERSRMGRHDCLGLGAATRRETPQPLL